MDLTNMSDMIKKHMEDKTNEVFYKALPAAIELSDGQIMGSNTFNNLQLAAETGRWEILNGIEYAEGGVVSSVANSTTPGSIDVTYIKDGEKFLETVPYNSGTILDLGNRLIKKTGATPTESLKAYNAFEKLLKTPVEDSTTPTTTSAPIDNEITGALRAGEYPEEFNELSTAAITGGDAIRAAFKKYGLVSSNTTQRGQYTDKYGETITLQNLAKLAFDRKGRDEYNSKLISNKKEMISKTEILQDYNSASSTEKADETSYDIEEVKKIMKKNGLGSFPGTDNFTKKDLALINYLKAGFKKENLDSDLASIDQSFN